MQTYILQNALSSKENNPRYSKSYAIMKKNKKQKKLMEVTGTLCIFVSTMAQRTHYTVLLGLGQNSSSVHSPL